MSQVKGGDEWDKAGAHLPRAFNSVASIACCPGWHEGLQLSARGGRHLSGPLRWKRLSIISMGLILAAPHKSMTRPTYENGGSRAAQQFWH